MEEYKSPDEKSEAQKAFEKYKKEQEEAGVPIDSRAVAAGEKELKDGKRGGYPTYKDEPDRSEKIKSYPKGRSQEEDELSEMEEAPDMSKISLIKEEVEKEIAELTEARKILVHFMETSDIDDLHKLTLSDLKERMFDLPDNIVAAANFLYEKDFEDNLILPELPEAIRERIQEDALTLKDLQK